MPEFPAGFSLGPVVRADDFGADRYGNNDSLSAITNAIAAVGANTYGGTVLFSDGVYATSAPIMGASQVVLTGTIPSTAAAESGGSLFASGTVIQPMSGWAGGVLSNPAAIYMDGSGGTLYQCGVRNLWIDGSNLPSGSAAVTLNGSVFHSKLLGVGVWNVPTDGIRGQVAGGGRPDGCTFSDSMVQSFGGFGVWWHGQDSQFHNVHVQGTQSGAANTGCWWFDNFNNGMLSDCRADQGTYGFVFDSNPGGATNVDSPGSTIRMVNCGTENTYHQALWLNNTNDPQMRTPVSAMNCSFDYAGRDMSSPAIMVTGYNLFNAYNCNVTSGGPGSNFYPAIGLKTQTGGGGGTPALVNIDGGFWNVCTQTGSPPEGAGTFIQDSANVAGTSGCIMRYRIYGSASTNVIGGGSPTAIVSHISGTWP
jgi:hypothetical protein